MYEGIYFKCVCKEHKLITFSRNITLFINSSDLIVRQYANSLEQKVKNCTKQ